MRAVLHVSGDGLRVVDDETRGLVVDQTIEKVSFCAPDRNYERGFSYICRDGTTRRWMCHGFFAVKESVSHPSPFQGSKTIKNDVGNTATKFLQKSWKPNVSCQVKFIPKQSSRNLLTPSENFYCN